MARPRLIVIVGATGDLAQRMLYPSLYFLSADQLIPDDLVIVGCSRGDQNDQEFAQRIGESVKGRAGEFFDEAKWQKLKPRLRHARLDATDAKSFTTLTPHVDAAQDVLFYFSTSPRYYTQICAHLRAAGLVSKSARVIVEKPIGRDLASCHAINDCLAVTFGEENVFRIDHY